MFFEETYDPNKAILDLTRALQRIENGLKSKSSLIVEPLRDDLEQLKETAEQTKKQLHDQAFAQRVHQILEYLSGITSNKDTFVAYFIEDKLEGMSLIHAVFQGTEIYLKRRALSLIERLAGDDVLACLIPHDDDWNTLGHILFKSPQVKADKFLVDSYFGCIAKLSQSGRHELFSMRNWEDKTIGKLIGEGTDDHAKRAYAQHTNQSSQAQASTRVAFVSSQAFKPVALPTLKHGGNHAADQASSADGVVPPPQNSITQQGLFRKRFDNILPAVVKNQNSNI